ncbi:hypothetical protein FS749_011774 [Ceratobasidium sp. UAMH 11750]|nr:hypothetical protein FS749_011774 [Ceratobasidium sp. UAMH 11750]
MVLPKALQSRVTRLSNRLYNLMDKLGKHNGGGDKVNKQFLEVLSDICRLVREETANQSLYLADLVEAVQEIIDDGVNHALGESGLDVFDFMPSWAHDNGNGQPLIEDTIELKLELSKEGIRRLFRAFRGLPKSRLDEMTPDPWKDSMKLHPKSSPLARPRPNLPSLTPTAANPVAMSVYDARCEIQSESISSPIKLCLSRGNVCLALNAAGARAVPHRRTGLADVASHVAIDETRRLIFVGDGERVKSYAWATPGGSNYKGKPLPMHTLSCRRTGGPIAVLPNGTVVRAGRGRTAVWDMDSLETHGKDGKRIIGEEDRDILEDTMRDDSEGIELSTGSSQNSYIKFAGHPDLSVTGAGDPQVFLTACDDGYARMFDLRTPLPIVTFDACQLNETCDAAVLAHPDGIPTVFTGTGKAEQVKMWDVRARTPVYELATGNNQVKSLAWDSDHNCLYTATECSYQERRDYRYGYRGTRRRPIVDSEDEDYEPDDFDRKSVWPKNAWHYENYFGCAFNAGNHRIYRYAFKEGPGNSVAPRNGGANTKISLRSR